MKAILASLVLLCCSWAMAQDLDTSYPDFTGKSLLEIQEQKDWFPFLVAKGNLDEDGQEDVVIVLESRDSIPEKRCSSCYVQKNKARILLVLIAENGTARVTLQNNKFIARADEGGMLTDFAPEIAVKGGRLEIYYELLKGYITYTFVMDNDEPVLATAKTVGVSGDIMEASSYDFIKKILVVKRGHISEKDTAKQSFSFELPKGLKKLSDFQQMYEWEVLENHYL